MPATRDLAVVKGDSVDVVFNCVTPAGGVFNLTGFNIFFVSGSVSKNSFDPTQIEVTDAVNGIGAVHLLMEDTVTFISSQRYSLWIERVSPAGDHFTILCGRVKFKCVA